MVARVTRKKSGLSQYLITGKRKNSNYSRDQKDKVTSLYGNLNIFAKTESYLVNHKSYKDNYLHLTLGFSKSEMQILESAPNKDEILKNLTRDYIAYYTTGYNLENEVIAYAEAHEPKMEHEPIENDKGEIIGHKLKERLSHIHIAIALHNPVTDKQLRPPFFNLKRDDAFKSQMCEKYGLEKPVREIQREKNFLSFIGKRRARLIEFLKIKGFKNGEEVMSWLKDNNVEFRVVKTGKNHYIKVIGENGSFNIRGRALEHLELGKSQKISQTPTNTRDNIPINPDIEALDISKLKKEIRDEALERWRERRIYQIDRARKTHEKREKTRENAEFCAISYQNKVFFNRYQTKLKRDLSPFYIDTKKAHQTHFTSITGKGVDILDTGDKLTATGTNTSEQVALMLDIAKAKGWSLYKLKVTGSEAFKAEVEKQINERIQRIKNEVGLQKIKTIQNALLPQRTPQNRTYTPIDSLVRAQQEHKHKIDIIKDFYKTADVNLITKFLLDEQFSKQYMPNLKKPIGEFYEQQGDRVLNKQTSKSKSIISIIDFFTKDAKMPMQTALAWLDKVRIEEIERQKREKIAQLKKEKAELQAEKDKILKEQEAQRARELESQRAKELESQKAQEQIKKRDVFEKYMAEVEAEQQRMWQETREQAEREYQRARELESQRAKELESQKAQKTTQEPIKEKENKPKIRTKKHKKSNDNDYERGI